MKKYGVITVLIITMFFVFSGLVQAEDIDLPGAAATFSDGEMRQANVNGVWELEYCWDGAECGITYWTVIQFSVFFLIDDSYYLDPIDCYGLTFGSFFLTKYKEGCKAIYQSRNATDTFMSGTMKCEDDSWAGTWSARSVDDSVTPEPINNGISPAGS